MSINKPSLDLYPPVEPPATADLMTWAAVIRLSYHDPVVRLAVTLAERGDFTREQALIAALFALYNVRARMFQAEVDRRNTEVPADFIIHDGKIYVRREDGPR